MFDDEFALDSIEARLTAIRADLRALLRDLEEDSLDMPAVRP